MREAVCQVFCVPCLMVMLMSLPVQAAMAPPAVRPVLEGQAVPVADGVDLTPTGISAAKVMVGFRRILHKIEQCSAVFPEKEPRYHEFYDQWLAQYGALGKKALGVVADQYQKQGLSSGAARSMIEQMDAYAAKMVNDDLQKDRSDCEIMLRPAAKLPNLREQYPAEIKMVEEYR